MLRYGLVSTSTIAPRFIGAIKKTDHSVVFAVASRSLEKAQAFARQHDIPTAYGSYQELFADKEIDILYISTPHDTHYELAKQGLLHGKHVIIEKPIVLQKKQAAELFDLALKSERFIMEAQKSLFLPITHLIKEIIDDKRYGELKQIDMTQSFESTYPNGHWMTHPQTGGILNASGSYTFEYIDFLLDCPSLTGSITTIKNHYGTTEAANISLVANQRILISSLMAMNVNTNNDAVFYFEHGNIIVHDYWKARSALVNGEKVEFPMDYEMVYEVNHIHECIKKGKLVSDIASPQRSLLSIEWIEKSYINE